MHESAAVDFSVSDSPFLVPGGTLPQVQVQVQASAAAVSVLLIEDDRNIQRSVSFQLGRQGYEVTVREDGEQGLAEALRRSYDVILLDIMLPSLDGLTLCKRLRALHPDQPIIITSARNSEVDKITGLEFGADDYVAKPFCAAELEARIRAVRRRAQPALAEAVSDVLTVGPVMLDARRREVRVCGEAIRLTPKEFELLSVMMRAPGRVFTRELLLAQIWGFSYSGYNRAVDAHVNRIRLKLQEKTPGQPEWLESVYGVGYRFREPPAE